MGRSDGPGRGRFHLGVGPKRGGSTTSVGAWITHRRTRRVVRRRPLLVTSLGLRVERFRHPDPAGDLGEAGKAQSHLGGRPPVSRYPNHLNGAGGAGLIVAMMCLLLHVWSLQRHQPPRQRGLGDARESAPRQRWALPRSSLGSAPTSASGRCGQHLPTFHRSSRLRRLASYGAGALPLSTGLPPGLPS